MICYKCLLYIIVIAVHKTIFGEISRILAVLLNNSVMEKRFLFCQNILSGGTMDNRIVIKKRSSEGVVCWRVKANEVTPNTVIVPDKGITVLVTIDGITQPMDREYVVYSLFNPGKGKKMFGGNKPYSSCEIYAIDRSSEFQSEWGLGGPNAIPCRDMEMGVDCTAVCFGSYRYKIENFVNFKNAIPLDKNGAVTRDAIREFLRTETTDVIRAYLSSKIAGKNLPDCAKYFGAFQEDLKEEINRRLDSKGLTVYSFGIERLTYSPEHMAAVNAANKAKETNFVNHIVNKGVSEDIDLDAKRVSNIIVPLKNAENGDAKDVQSKKENGRHCPRCYTENPADALYCSKCGEKLIK